jgi:CubicO group peptidase (beta-lactamase class C family)
MNIENIWENWNESKIFSGVFSVADEEGTVFEKCTGLRNRSEGLPNTRDTAYGIVSGTKLSASLAVCKLMDTGQIKPLDLAEQHRQRLMVFMLQQP